MTSTTAITCRPMKGAEDFQMSVVCISGGATPFR